MALPTILTSTYPLSPAAKHLETAPFADDDQWKLFITTHGRVCAWEHRACDTLFTSASQGIVAAKRARDGSMLAIADAQVVMLHRIEAGQDKSYRLKGTQRCRLLQYDHESRNLFFTDSLHHSVQAYSLHEKRVAEATNAHQSPVTAFAISCDSNLILSCSASPPTVQTYNRMHTTAISLAPQASSASVVTCAFHPSRKNIFMLAFADGVLAAYDYNKLSSGSRAKGERGPGAQQSVAKAIHAFKHLHDPSVAGTAGTTAVAFVPGHRGRAVSVGEDGRMFLLDFEKGDTLASWHTGAPATALAIRPVSPAAKASSTADKKREKKEDRGGYMVAIGTVHGRCYVYDGLGNRIGEKVVDADGGAILDVEWVHGEVGLPVLDADTPLMQSPPKSTPPATLRQNLRARPLNSATKRAMYAQGSNPSISPPSPGRQSPVVPEGRVLRSRSRPSLPAQEVPLDTIQEAASQSYMKLFSPVKKKRVTKATSLPETKGSNDEKTSDPRVRANEDDPDFRTAISAPQLWDDPVEQEPDKPKSMLRPENEPKPENVLDSVSLPAEIHKKPLTIRGAPSAVSELATQKEQAPDSQFLSEIRSIRAKVSGRAGKPTGGLALFAPYIPSRNKSSPAALAKPKAGVSNNARRSASNLEVEPVDTHTPTSTATSILTPSTHASATASPKTASPAAADAPENVGMDGYRTDNVAITQQISPEQSSDAHSDGVVQQMEDSTAPQRQPSPAESEEDIWLLESKRTRRKRRLSTHEEPQTTARTAASSVSAAASLSSSIRSTKSRKTVSWEDDPPPALTPVSSQNSVFHSPPAAHSLLATFSSSSHVATRATSSRPSSSPLAESSVHRNIHPQPVLTSASSENRAFFTPGGATSALSAPGLDPALAAALRQMQKAMQQEMRSMQGEMQRHFREQRAEIVGLREDMGKVREENAKLRGQLFAVSGVRDGVRDRLRRVSSENTAAAAGIGAKGSVISPESRTTMGQSESTGK